MRKEESRTDLGVIKIHNNVIASIAAIAAGEIQGVKRIGGDFKSGLLELIRGKYKGAIKVEFDKNEELKLEVPLIIKYGFNVPDIASRVQENIRNNLEKMINLSIRDINITILGIERGGNE